jgi:hypothetical protein
MMKKLLSLFFAISLTLSGCATAYIQSTPIPTHRPTHAASPTKTLIPSHTPRPITPTILPKIPTFAPTFDVSTILTVTPAPQAECPQINSQANLVLNEVLDYVPETNEIAPPILDFLNKGGGVNKLIQEVNQVYGRGEVILGTLQDITNDGIPDVIIEYPGLLIFICQNGQYFLAYEKGGLASYRILDDLNKNGIPEILDNFFMSNAGADIGLQEWNGSEFSSIGHLGIDGGFQYQIIDWNGDGLSEFIFRGGAPGICCEDELNPWRYKTKIYAWNGSIYDELYEFFDAPQYRFQAIQDADREMLYGYTETALKLYEDAVFADTLEWWSADKKHYTDEIINNRFQNPTPTPSTPPTEDLTEYPRLAAYAYYRIMLLHLGQGQEAEAASTYQTLYETYGNDPYAASYVKMASAFWEAYQSTRKMYDGCAAAIQYAVEHPEILVPLGSDYHGWQSHIYEPADVCPFR